MFRIFLGALALMTIQNCGTGDDGINGTWTLSSVLCGSETVTDTYKDGADTITMSISGNSGTETASFSTCNRSTTLTISNISSTTKTVLRESETCGSACVSSCNTLTPASSVTYNVSASSLSWEFTNSQANYCANAAITINWTR